MNGRTFYAVESSGSRVLFGRVPTAYAVGLLRASKYALPKPTGRKAAGKHRKTLRPQEA